LKHNKIKLKWKIFIYMLGFTSVLIAMLWLLQTVYLDDFYEYTKMKEFESAVESIAESGTYENMLINVAYEAKSKDVCVLVVDSVGRMVCSAESNPDCTIHYMTSLQLAKQYEKTKDNGGKLTCSSEEILVFENFKDNFGGGKDRENNYRSYPFGEFQDIPRRNYSADGVVGMRIFNISSGSEFMVVVNTIITPVDAVVDTIRVQLIFISVILVILALLLATFVSMTISRSITKVNESAKELAEGNFDVKFTGNDYKEISELSKTLNYAASELGKTEEIRRELIANVSHDLRTPLTMITAYSEVMRDLPGENTPENVQVIIDEANRLTLLVNDLLDISKLQAGVDNLNIKEYNLTDAVRKVIERYGKLVNQEGYSIEFNYEEDVFVKADEFKLYQVVYNLISNAINYTGEDKKVTVNQIVNNGIVRIEVCDTGQGIPKEEIKNVWNRYYKIDKNHKRAIIGTGLGLSIVNNILKMHGAKYGVDSEIGNGSKFWFELPIDKKSN